MLFIYPPTDLTSGASVCGTAGPELSAGLSRRRHVWGQRHVLPEHSRRIWMLPAATRKSTFTEDRVSGLTKDQHQALPLFSGSQADCCSDHLHCCYEGTVCDLVHSKCVNKTVTLPLVTRLPARRPLPAPQVNSHLLCTSSLPVDLCSKTTGPFVCLLLLSLDLGLTQKMILDIWATLN